MELYWIILGPFLAAWIAPCLAARLGGHRAGLVLSLVPFLIAGWMLSLAPRGVEPQSWQVPGWLPGLEVSLALRADATARLFVLLISFIGGLICIYGGAYLAGEKGQPRFFAILFVFMAAMLGIAIADDLLVLFVFWELTSMTSFLLVGYKHKDEKARKAALQALIVTGGGGLALLAGIVLLGQMAGSYQLSQWSNVDFAAGPHYGWALALVLVGCFTKSAQVPFHFWLPGAMAAPTPVSAYLHSATMVKAGVILLVKLWPFLAHTPAWWWSVVPVGALTMLTGAAMAVGQTDLKRLLAYTTVSMLGSLVLLLGLGEGFALKTALFLILVHGLYKGALFMVAGTIDHATGTRNVRELSGLGRALPLLAVAAGLAAASMCGLPPFLGFISKELFYEAQLESAPAWASWTLAVAAVLANMFAVAVALIVGVRPFLGKGSRTAISHAPELGLVFPPLLLGGLGLALGLSPKFLDSELLKPAMAALGADGGKAKLALWHGFTLVLALSGLTVGGGLLVYFLREPMRQLAASLARASKAVGPTRVYEALFQGTLGLAAWLTRTLQNGNLTHYLRLTIVATFGLLGWAVWQAWPSLAPRAMLPVGLFDLSVIALMIGSATAALFAQSRLTAILCLGGVGYSVALSFVAFGAPDLAITQLLVETLTVVLFSFVLMKLPSILAVPWRSQRHWDAGLALAVGVVMAFASWQTFTGRVAESISPWLVERSLPEAYGRNVVNVILVDFRALDTMGEILVLALGLLGVASLLARRRIVALAMPRKEKKVL